MLDKLHRWRLSLPWPHRCPECKHWTMGALEGITNIRFALCDWCVLGEDRDEAQARCLPEKG